MTAWYSRERSSFNSSASRSRVIAFSSSTAFISAIRFLLMPTGALCRPGKTSRPWLCNQDVYLTDRVVFVRNGPRDGLPVRRGAFPCTVPHPNDLFQAPYYHTIT